MRKVKKGKGFSPFKRKIIKGDEVILICGKDKGKRGTVLKVSQERILVEGLNLVKKCVRPNPQTNEPGGIISQEALIHYSNVALWNADTQKTDKAIFRTEKNGKRVRVYQSTNKLIQNQGLGE